MRLAIIKIMKNRLLHICLSAALIAMSQANAVAQVGTPFIHDPSTIMKCEGKYYTFGTFEGGLVSEDGWTWKLGGVRPHGGAAPDVVKIGNRYLVAYGATGGGLGGGHNGRILTMWNKTLNPESPDFKYSEPVIVASSDGKEDNDAIDPGLFLDPNDGRLWMSYGTYFGYIRLVELNPATGTRVAGNKPIDIAIDCEATDLIFHDGWYYLLGTHGTCCDGPNSTYNIVVGRSRKVTGPYLDNVGRDMLQGGGKMLLGARGGLIGPGHFGLWNLDDGVQKMSCHYEADMTRGGYSVLGTLPLLWQNGWPVAGYNLQEGNYEIESVRRGYSLELAVDFVRIQNTANIFHRDSVKAETNVPLQSLKDVEGTWPEGNIDVRMSDYMSRPHQKWTVTAVGNCEGCAGGPYYKIEIEGTHRALTAEPESKVGTVACFTGAPEQLWQIDQLTDGTYRIMPKAIPGTKEKLALVSIGDCTPILAKFNMNSDNSKWNLRHN